MVWVTVEAEQSDSQHGPQKPNNKQTDMSRIKAWMTWIFEEEPHDTLFCLQKTIMEESV